MSGLAVAGSSRVFAALAANSVLAVTLVVVGILGNSGAHAQQREFVATVIVACDHSGRTTLATRVSGLETAGRVDRGLTAALQERSSCAEIIKLLTDERFELVHRLTSAPGDANGDGDVDGRDFLIWQRHTSPASARRFLRAPTVLVRCEYMVVGGLVTRVTGSEIAGAIDASLAAALAAGPTCAEAYAALAGAGFDLISVAPSHAGDTVHSQDLAFWGQRWF